MGNTNAMRIFGPILLLLLFCGPCLAQQYLNLSVDNDLYFGLDRYYSSGVFISSGAEKKGEDREGSFPKKYVHWTLGQEIYTPSNRYSTDVNSFDYPYGGWLFLERREEYSRRATTAWSWSLQMGMTGKASLGPYLQNLYHDKVLGLREVSWEQALPQRLHLNLKVQHKRRWNWTRHLAVLYEFFGALGTQRTTLGGRAGLLLGNAPILSFLGNPLENQKKSHAFYVGSRQEYRFHDFMISGSLFDQKAPFVMDPIQYKNSLELGVAFFTKKWRFLTLWNSISPDNNRQKAPRHYFLNISIARGF